MNSSETHFVSSNTRNKLEALLDQEDKSACRHVVKSNYPEAKLV